MYKKMLTAIAVVILSVSIVVCTIGVIGNTKSGHPSSDLPNDPLTGSIKQGSSSKGTIIVNGSVPISAGYIGTLDAANPVKVDMVELTSKIREKLGRNPKILISSFHMTNDWNRLVSRSAINAGKEVGAEVIATNAQGNWNRQVDDVEYAISSRVDAIVIAGGISRSLQEVIKKAAKEGIPVTTVDIPSPYVLTNVTSDNFSAAAMLVMKMALDMEGKGNIAVIHSPGWHSIDIRRYMLDVVLKDWPEIRIVTEQPVDEEDAVNGTMTTMESILQKFPEKGSLDAVFTGFGLAGAGAAKAIEAAGRSDDISVYTVDADIIVLKDILKKNGAIKACIGQTTTQLGRTATVIALKGIIGDTKDIKKQTFCPITLVTKKNADKVGKYLYGDEWK